MNKTGVVFASLAAAATATLWSMSELALLSTHPQGDWLAVVITVIWGVSYTAGILFSRILMSSPRSWRLPFILGGLLLVVTAGLFLSGDLVSWPVGMTVAYSLITIVLTLLSNSAARIAVETTPSFMWGEIAVFLRGFTGVLHALFSLFIGRILLAHYGYDLEAAIEILTPPAVLGAIIAGFSFRLPVIPETIFKGLDLGISHFAFGEGPVYRRFPQLLVVLAASSTILKMLSIQEASSINPSVALPLYAIIYAFGSIYGVLNPSPKSLSILLGVGLLAAALSPGPLARLSIGVFIAGASEAGLFYSILEYNPMGAWSILARIASATVLVGIIVEGIQSIIGASYDDALGAIALTAFLISFAASARREPRW